MIHRGKRGRLALLAIVLLAIVLWSYQRSRQAHAVAAQFEPLLMRSDVPLATVRQVGVAGQPTRAAPAAEEPAPVVDEVLLEKSEVCYGEENLVTVRAHTTNRTDDELHYAVGGIAGRAVPVVLFPQDEGAPERRSVSVFGRNNVATTVPVPAYRVKDCGKRPLVLVEYRARANRPDEFDFAVRLLGIPKGLSFERFDWDFGDGQGDSTTEPFAVHSYRDRLQAGFYSQYLVQVSAKTNTRERHLGRVALQLQNRAYQTRKLRGVVVLEADYEPRFPTLDQYGMARQTVRLFHHELQPVTLEKLYVEKQFIGTASATKLSKIELDSVLPSSVVPPGDGLRFELRLDTEAEPDTFGLNYLVTGTFGALTVQGGFSLLRPPKTPTKEEHVPVYERAFKAKIVTARRLLNKAFVTDEEIQELERKGAFKGAEFAETDSERARSGPPIGFVSPPRDGHEVKGPGSIPSQRPPPVTAPEPPQLPEGASEARGNVKQGPNGR